MNLSARTQNDISALLNINIDWGIRFIKLFQTLKHFMIVLEIRSGYANFKDRFRLWCNWNKWYTILISWECAWFEDIVLKSTNSNDVACIRSFYTLWVMGIEKINIVYFCFCDVFNLYCFSVFICNFLFARPNYKHLLSSFEFTWKYTAKS